MSIIKASGDRCFFNTNFTDTDRKSGERNKMEFTPIMTQEDFDAAIKDRLKRDRETQSKRYEGWISPEDQQKRFGEYEQQIKSLQDAATAAEKTLAEKDALIAEGAKYKTDLEKTRIALAAGLDVKYAGRLVGENEKEWQADAEMLAKDFAANRRTAPIGSSEPNAQNQNSAAAAWRAVSTQLNE